MSIAELLYPKHVNLSLVSKDRIASIEEVIAPLRGDPRIRDWEALRASIMERNAPAISEHGRGVCLAHGRTDAVKDLVMAAGRFPEPVAFPEIPEKVCLVFAVGIPTAMSSEYLRIIGAVVRICRDPVQLERLMRAKTSEEFIQKLVASQG